MSAPFKLEGKVFGQLTVIRKAGTDKFRHALWLCKCGVCGREKVIMGDHLTRGQTKYSCGCIGSMTTHGMCGSPEYYTYTHAKSRRQNPDTKHYEDYGGRGIQFKFDCFEDFFLAIGPRPEGRSLERIDNDGHYEKGNIRWATKSEQQYNRRVSINKLMREVAWG